MVRSQLVDAITGPAAGSATLARALSAWQNEERRGRALLVEAAAMPAAEPTDKDLQSYLDAHADSYKSPERRSVDIIVLSPDDLAGEVTVSEDEIKKAYEDDKAQYRKPERRRLLQLLAPDRATIEEAAKKVAAGESFAAVADELGGKVSTTTVGPVAAGDLPDPLDKAAFALGPDEVSKPLQTSFGWHLLRLVGVEPASEQPLTEVRGQIQKALALKKADRPAADPGQRARRRGGSGRHPRRGGGQGRRPGPQAAAGGPPGRHGGRQAAGGRPSHQRDAE